MSKADQRLMSRSAKGNDRFTIQLSLCWTYIILAIESENCTVNWYGEHKEKITIGRLIETVSDFSSAVGTLSAAVFRQRKHIREQCISLHLFFPHAIIHGNIRLLFCQIINIAIPWNSFKKGKTITIAHIFMEHIHIFDLHGFCQSRTRMLSHNLGRCCTLESIWQFLVLEKSVFVLYDCMVRQEFRFVCFRLGYIVTCRKPNIPIVQCKGHVSMFPFRHGNKALFILYRKT